MSYVQLTPGERYVIYHLKLFKLSLREIARRLGRHHSTISRELRRNGPVCSDWAYWHEDAQQQAMQRRSQARHQRKYDHAAWVRRVEQCLNQQWSPEAIAGRLRLDYPENENMRVSAETIYRWVYRDAAQGGWLFACLCRRNRKRRRQRRYGSGRGLIPGRISIAERPALVDARQRFGDWEGDTVEGAKGSGNIATHVERKSRYLIAASLINKTAALTAQTVVAAYRRIPRRLRVTLTLDNGKEFARFKDIESGAGLAIYLADPYSAWQRGTNEIPMACCAGISPKEPTLEK